MTRTPFLASRPGLRASLSAAFGGAWGGKWVAGDGNFRRETYRPTEKPNDIKSFGRKGR